MPLPQRLLQVLSPGETLMYPAALALARQTQRQDGQSVIAGPLLRYQQEQVMLLDGRWVNLPLTPYRPGADTRGEQTQVARLVDDFAPDLIHAYGLAALKAVMGRRRAPVVCTLTDVVTAEPQGWERWRLRRMLGACAGISVSSESDVEALGQLDARLARRAQLLHPPVELKPVSAAFDLAQKRRTLGLRSETAVVGVISPAGRNLGLESVLAAAVTITEDFPNVEFLFVGDGPEQERLMLAAHDMGVGGAIVFRGDRADVNEVIATLNTLVIPREVSGSVGYALQAVALEIPVVAVQTPALAEVLGPVEPDAFVPADDAGALAAMLARRLEILPPPDDGAFAEFGGFSRSDMLVSGLEIDLDSVGLEAEWRGDASVRQLAVRRAQQRYSAGKVAERLGEVYEGVLSG